MSDQRFDWPPALDAPFIEALVNTMFPKADPPKSGVNVQVVHEERYEIATQVISALYQTYSSPHSVNSVSFPRRASAYKAGHQTLVPFSRTRATEVFNRLVELEWVKVTEEDSQTKYTRIEAIGDLAETFDDVGLVWFPQRPIPKHRTVLLRDVVRGANGKPKRTGKKRKTKKVWVDVKQTDDVKRMQDNLHVINSFLSKQCITLDLDDEQLRQVAFEVRQKESEDVPIDDMEADSLVDLRRVQLVRIFARGSMDKGGRFYRGWWQGIPSKYRPHLRINGKKTVEIDYSTMHLSILYAKAGLKPTKGHDAYDLGLNLTGKDDPRRKHIKVAVNALLNDEDGIYKLNKKTEAAIGLTNEQFHEALKKTHPKLYDLMTSDVGLGLQRTDSDIAETVLLWFTHQDIPCLPIHDSFIVPAGYGQYLETVLKEAFRVTVGSDIDVDIEVVKNREHFGMTEDELNDIPLEDRVINGDDIYDRIFSRKEKSLMENYLGSYETIRHKVNP